MKYFEIPITVRFDETDEMGIVHHKHYLSWFEVARFELLKHINADFAALRNDKVGFMVHTAFCKYILPARFTDELIVQLSLRVEKKSMLVFHYNIRRKRDFELLAEGKTEHVITVNWKVVLGGIPAGLKEKINNTIAEFGWDKEQCKKEK